MAYFTFDRQILAKIETTEGTAATPNASNYIDTLTDITFEYEPVLNARDLVRPGFAMIPDAPASTEISAGNLVGTGTISFQVEAAMKSGSSPVTTAPAWGALLQACGMTLLSSIKRTGTGGTITSGPILNRENLLVSASAVGQAVGTTFTGDTYIYYKDGGGISNSDSVSGEVSSASFTASGTEADVGLAYVMDTSQSDGDGSSLSMYLYRHGRSWNLRGARGTVDFQFTATDRLIMSFTFQGALYSIANASKLTGINPGNSVPSVFVDAELKINEHGAEATAWTGANFESLTLSMGNSVVLRPDANNASGFKSAIINGRNPTLSGTFDSVVGGTTSSTVFDWAKMLATAPSVRAEWKTGTGMDAKSLLFRAPALQVTGDSADDRETVEASSIEAKLTGGLYGDSVVASSGDDRYYTDRGHDNELTIVLF